ncbi:exodeoxyribonuclease VII large subunit [Helicobacter sp. MIT 99-5507]|uniref:exodeoxyribonuclease VII large subunit n=1 Tax=Helicobacter sp. MIT 99-5507 TaxID=152489 RepID=UPI000E1EBAF3|nr:exodeoxyribonuclease VII large subunit [Helicobacter sp. MIT 99-5507]RDU58315.1 exodeoxyribonuclease VII large subunit [Helicobacter sp. MIT 99-5507]
MNILSVTQLTKQIKQTLINYFGEIQIQGEIGSLTNHQSGHCYFTLKDSNASIRCMLFKGTRAKLNNIILKTDMQVIVTGNLSIYESRGEYQIICSNVKEYGIGNLAIKFEELKEKLKNKGYFESSIKKDIPKFPKKIALITSLSGAALKDMKFVANRCWNLTRFTIFDTLVQGNEAKYMIERNIKIADSLGFDIIVLARGGGSLEDLWAFNEEIVLEAIYNAKTPIVSAIGHETDTPLSDFVSDLRAPTPSACMEMILPDKNEWLLRLSDLFDNINNIENKNLLRFKEMLDSAYSKLNFFKFNYNSLNDKLHSMRASLNLTLNRHLNAKIETIKNLSIYLDVSYKNIYPSKIQNIKILKYSLQNLFSILLAQKRIFDKKELDFQFDIFLKNKENELKKLKLLLEAKNPKNKYQKGYAQITIDNKILSLDEVKKGDTITLSDGITSKEARIL